MHLCVEESNLEEKNATVKTVNTFEEECNFWKKMQPLAENDKQFKFIIAKPNSW